MNFNRDVYEFEIYGAAARVGVNIDSLHYLIPDHGGSEVESKARTNNFGGSKYEPMRRYTSAQKWDHFLSFGEDFHQDDSADKKVEGVKDLFNAATLSSSVKTLSRRVTLRSTLNVNTHSLRRRVTIREVLEPCIRYATVPDDSTRSTGFYASVAMAVSTALVPVFHENILYLVPHTFYHRVLAILYLTSSTFLTAFYGWVIFQFMFTMTIDTQRRLRIASLMTGLVRPVHQDYSAHISLFGFDGVSIAGIIWKQCATGMRSLRQVPSASRVAVDGASQDNMEDGKLYDSVVKEVDISRGVTVTHLGNTERQYEVIDCPTKKSVAQLDAHIPKVDFEIPQNIYAWMYTRLVIQNYGNRMLFRISLYSGGVFLMVLIVGFGLVFAVLHSSDPVSLSQRPVVIQCILLALSSVLILIDYIFLGARLNDEFAAHRNLLVLNAMKCESELAELLTAESDMSFQLVHATLGVEGNGLTSSAVSGKGRPLKLSSKLAPEGSSAIRNSSVMDALVDTARTSQKMTSYQQVAVNRMDSRFEFTTAGNDNSVRVWTAPADENLDDVPIVESKSLTTSDVNSNIESRPSGARDASDSSATSHMLPYDMMPHNPEHSIKTRLKIFELEESVKAMRRAVEAIDVSNNEYTAKVIMIITL
jgi:hypothetical protein